jgi:hypothetical protein
MVLPSKHLSSKRALVTIGAELLTLLDAPKTLSRLWEEARRPKAAVLGETPRLSYKLFVLSLDLLYTIGAVELDGHLLIKRPAQ